MTACTLTDLRTRVTRALPDEPARLAERQRLLEEHVAITDAVMRILAQDLAEARLRQGEDGKREIGEGWG